VRAFPERSLFVLQISIVALAPKVIIRDFALSIPDWDSQVDFLTDPCLNNSRAEYNRLYDGTDFHRSEVLNHRVGSDGTLRRGDLLEGVLLADGPAPTPPSHPSGTCTSVRLATMDQFDDVCPTWLDVYVERPATQARRQRVRRGLYDPSESPSAFPNSAGKLPPRNPAEEVSKDLEAKLAGLVVIWWLTPPR